MTKRDDDISSRYRDAADRILCESTHERSQEFLLILNKERVLPRRARQRALREWQAE